MEYCTSPSFYNSSNKKNNWYYNTEIGDSSLKDKMRKYSQEIRNKTKRNGKGSEYHDNKLTFEGEYKNGQILNGKGQFRIEEDKFQH